MTARSAKQRRRRTAEEVFKGKPGARIVTGEELRKAGSTVVFIPRRRSRGA